MTREDASLPSLPAERVLLVEGQDDKHVVEHFYTQRFGSKPPFVIFDKEGYAPLCRAIGPELKAPDRQVVGIIVDANDDPESRWQAVTDRLRRARPGIDVGDPAPGGWMADGRPRVGVWLWPDNESSGEVEDFIAAMIPRDDPVWPLSRRCTGNIPAGERRFREGKTARAEVHAWLATRARPRRMGAAIGAGDLEIDGGLAVRVASWLSTLFRDPAWAGRPGPHGVRQRSETRLPPGNCVPPAATAMESRARPPGRSGPDPGPTTRARRPEPGPARWCPAERLRRPYGAPPERARRQCGTA